MVCESKIKYEKESVIFQKKMPKRAATPIASQKLADIDEAVLARGGGV